MTESWAEVLENAVRDRCGAGLIETAFSLGIPVLVIEPENIVDVVEVLKEGVPESNFSVLLDVTAVDYLYHAGRHPQRFAVVWHFLDFERGRRIRVKAYVADGETVPSLSDIYPAANWAEREVFDMMGIGFSGHPNMIRILMPYDYDGNPQRKDFPLEGPERAKRVHGELLGNKPLTSWSELHDL